jgi:hypothetical protein
VIAPAGSVVAALGVAALVLVRNRAWRAAGLAAWVAGCALLAAHLLPAGHAWLYLGSGLGGAVLAAGIASVFLRLPWLLVAAILACVPVRITTTVGHSNAALLVPLYVVVAAAALALAWQLLWKSSHGRELGPFAWPLALFVAWSGIALVWSDDRRQGALYLLLYVLPFALLAVAVARVPWVEGWATAAYVQLALMAATFAAIGLWRYEARDVIWSPRAITGGARVASTWFHPVDSVFRDPSTYGSFLVVAVLAGLVVVQYASPGVAWLAVVPVVVAFAGLFPSFSRAAYVALASGVVVSLGALWRRRSVVPVAVAFASLLAVAAGVAHAREHVLPLKPSAPISDGIRVGLDHPYAGVGTGAFPRAYADRTGSADAPHDAPITVAAELGAPGLALLTWLVLAILAVTLRKNAVRGPTLRALLGLGLALIAILAHSIVDGGLFEDPLFWTALALAAIAARAEAVA